MPAKHLADFSLKTYLFFSHRERNILHLHPDMCTHPPNWVTVMNIWYHKGGKRSLVVWTNDAYNHYKYLTGGKWITPIIKMVNPCVEFISGKRKYIHNSFISQFNSLWPSDAIWQHGTRSTLAQVMACCLTTPSHYLNQCWLVIGEVPWHSSQGIILRWCEDTNQ